MSPYGAAVADDRLKYVLAVLAFAMTGAIVVMLWLMQARDSSRCALQ